MRKKLFKLLVSFLSIGFFLTIFLLIRKESGVYEFKEGQSFSETQNLVFQLSEEEKRLRLGIFLPTAPLPITVKLHWVKTF